jgi:hypothetical protein
MAVVAPFPEGWYGYGSIRGRIIAMAPFSFIASETRGREPVD